MQKQPDNNNISISPQKLDDWQFHELKGFEDFPSFAPDMEITENPTEENNKDTDENMGICCPMDAFYGTHNGDEDMKNFSSEENPKNPNDTEIYHANGVPEKDIPSEDIKLGRGRGLQKHPANIWFRKLIAELLEKYEQLNKIQKSEMNKKVYQHIMSQSRKFWKETKSGKNKACWKVLDTKESLSKIAYDFRSQRKRKKQKKSPPLAVQTAAQPQQVDEEIEPLPLQVDPYEEDMIRDRVWEFLED